MAPRPTNKESLAQRAGSAKWYEQPLRTNQGTFVFSELSDGIFIEHKWGNKSGQIGIPRKNLAEFIKYLNYLNRGAASSGGDAAAPRPASGPKKTIEKKPREKKEKIVKEKPTAENLDAELTSYLSKRGGEEGAPAEAAAPTA